MPRFQALVGFVSGAGLLLAGCEAGGGGPGKSYEVGQGELGGNIVGFNITLTVKCPVKNVTEAALNTKVTATLDNKQGGKWTKSEDATIGAGETKTVEIDFTNEAQSDVGRDSYTLTCKADKA